MVSALVAFCLLGIPLQDPRQASIEEAIRAYCTENKIPSVAYAIGERGQITLAGAVQGTAKDEISVRTVYRLGSISKSVTAVAFLQLAEQNRIDLDADIRKSVPEWPDKGVKITARQLLGHLGGIRHYSTTKSESYFTHFENAALAMNGFKDDPLVNQPGEKYSYSTHAFTILARACENASGKTFPNLIKERISIPLAIGTLRCEDRRTMGPNRAVLYIKSGDQVKVAPRAEDLSWKYGGGGIESTPSDLCRFAMAVSDGKLLKPSTVEQMWTSQKSNDGKPTGYGMGWSVGTGKFGRVVGHNGAQQGAQTDMKVFRDRGVTLVVMSNLQNQPLGTISNEIAQRYFAK